VSPSVGDRRGVESARVASSPDAKVAAMRSYRRAMGLCYKCNEKWAKDHRCSPIVQLHAVQQLWELFQLEDDEAEFDTPGSESGEQLLLAISKSTVTGCPALRTMKFLGIIQRHEVSILIDSGSSISFISESLAQQLSGIDTVHTSAAVQITGDGILHSLAILKQVEWEVSPYVFHTDLRVLPLAAYDVIIGMDWLESHNPMQVHWKLKWMEVPYQGQQIQLQREVFDAPTQLLLHVYCLT
jgi:hypothetical protein